MNSQGAKRASATLRLWWSDIDSSDLALSLPHCAEEVKMGSTICNEKNGCASSPSIALDCEESARYRAQERTKNKSMKGETTEDKQDDELASEMTEELNFSVTVSKNGGQPKHDAVPYKKPIEKNRQALDRTGSGLVAVTGSGGESEGCGDLRMYSMSVEVEQVRRLRSSQYKGVIPQPNGRWGAQIYEKHQRMWLGTFSSEEEAARAYDRAALKVRGREAITNFSSVGSRDQEERFMREHSKEEIVQMLRKHTYDEEMTMRVAQSGTDKAEASGEVEYGLISVCQENKEHLFDKALTPSDVGKLNRLVIPKQQAEKYFPMDVNSSENGLLLNFADNMGKVWRFHYTYWNSSQSYVLTKGWSRFVKEKQLEAEDIVSFHRGLTQSHQLYISWRSRPPGKQQFGASPQSHHSKWKGTNFSSSLDPFNSGNQAGLAYNAQWMTLFWPTSRNLDTIQPFSSKSINPLVNKVGDADALWSPIPITTLYVALPFHCSESSTKQTDINRGGLPSMELYLNLQNSINSGDGSPHIKPLGPSAAKELETPEYKEVSCLDSATATTYTEGIKLFGVTLSERQIYREVKSGDSQGQLRV